MVLLRVGWNAQEQLNSAVNERWQSNSGDGPYEVAQTKEQGLAFVLSALLVTPVFADPIIEDITFSSRPGSKFEVRLDFNEPPPADLDAYTIEEPARIAIDFPGTKSGLDQKRYALPYGNATGVLVLQAGDRTRMVINLVKLVPYETVINGNQLISASGSRQ